MGPLRDRGQNDGARIVGAVMPEVVKIDKSAPAGVARGPEIRRAAADFVTDPADLGRILGLDGQFPLTAPQKKSLVAAVDALGKRADSEQQKRVIKAIHEHYTK
jgi:hypothetical protein